MTGPRREWPPNAVGAPITATTAPAAPVRPDRSSPPHAGGLPVGERDPLPPLAGTTCPLGLGNYNGYNRGCRCGDCGDANSIREYRKANAYASTRIWRMAKTRALALLRAHAPDIYEDLLDECTLEITDRRRRRRGGSS